MRLQYRLSHLLQRGRLEPRKSDEPRVRPKGLCKFRLTLGLVRKSAVSGNSTGDRVTRDDDEPAPIAGGLWLGEVTGLRQGDVPGKEKGQHCKHEQPRKTLRRGSRLTCSPGPYVVCEGDRGRPLLGNGEQVCIGPIGQT